MPKFELEMNCIIEASDIDEAKSKVYSALEVVGESVVLDWSELEDEEAELEDEEDEEAEEEEKT